MHINQFTLNNCIVSELMLQRSGKNSRSACIKQKFSWFLIEIDRQKNEFLLNGYRNRVNNILND